MSEDNLSEMLNYCVVAESEIFFRTTKETKRVTRSEKSFLVEFLILRTWKYVSADKTTF